MVAVHQHLRLDDRHEAGFLRQRRVARERVRVRPEAVLARNALADRDDAAPLREPRTELAVLVEPGAQAVEPFGDRLALGESERLRALVDLDPRDDALRLEQFRKRRPVRRRLADRLVEEDHAADVLLDPLRGEEEVAVGAAVLLGRLDPDRVEALLDRPVALVGGEDALALGDDRGGGLVELLQIHFLLLRPFASARLCPRLAAWRGDAAAVAPPAGPPGFLVSGRTNLFAAA